MIVRVNRDVHFDSILTYVSDKPKAEFIGGNVSCDPLKAAYEMESLRRFTLCKNPVFHCSLSLSPQDRPVANTEFASISRDFLKKMELTRNQYCIYRHYDKEHPHVHIICNRIRLDDARRIWHIQFEILNAIKAKSELEKEYGLIEVPLRPRFANPDITKGEREEAERENRLPTKLFVAKAIEEAAKQDGVKAFVKELRKSNIYACPTLSPEGEVFGFRYLYGEHHYTGRQLRCSWGEVAKRINYAPETDDAYIKYLSKKTADMTV